VTFGIWMLVGLAAYFGYGRRHSRVAALGQEEYRELSGRNFSPAPASAEQTISHQ
jgi:APA family basic amino acid/polyamine antiporter